ncbi:MAG TPA: histidine kinase [Actinomycetales bacterium]|nr:histidine kinase [Actinomycetales bacterium]
MGLRAALTDVSLGARLRLLITVGCAALGLVQDVPLVVAGSAVVAAAELASTRSWRLATYVQVITTVSLVVLTGSHASAALPLLLLPVFRAGDLGRLRDVCLVSTTTGVLLVIGWLSLPPSPVPRQSVLTQGAVWLGLAIGLGVLQCLSLLLQARNETTGIELAAQEATYLVHRLDELVRRLPHGLHAPAVADELLEGVLNAAPGSRAAVLVRRDADIASPLVVRGSDRVPWRDPVHSAGPPSTAWRTKSTVTEVRPPDTHGRRHGSSMLCIPLLDVEHALLGLVVVERLHATPFDQAEVAAAEQAAVRFTPHLQAAIMFSELQLVASIAERERLAREMHDGIAQDLVALAFSLDVLGRQLGATSAVAEKAVKDVRCELTRMVRDIRFSISDLRSSVRPERGVGAALSSQVQSLASSTGLAVHLSLRESTFRLPAQIEAALLRAAQSMLHDIRADSTVSEIWLSLDVDPPRAELVLRHDGAAASHLSDELSLYLAQLGVAAREGPGELLLSTTPAPAAGTTLVEQR